jgi:hypothetical protein
MTNSFVNVFITFDYTKGVIVLNYAAQNLKEIYQFNFAYGWQTSDGQYSYKISPTAACSPCASYNNKNAFPAMWTTAVSGQPQSMPTATAAGADPDFPGCTRYTLPSPAFMSSYALNNGNLCGFKTPDGRLFKLVGNLLTANWDDTYYQPPLGCRCVKPLDLVLSLDRSGSITVTSTNQLKTFVQNFVQRFSYNPSDPYSTQLAIEQWGTYAFPQTYPGSISMSMNAANINTAANLIGCLALSPCNKCGGRTGTDSCNVIDQFTCPACGIRAAGILMQNRPVKRSNAALVMIVITDGNANTLYDSSYVSPDGSRKRCCGGGDSSAYSIGQSSGGKTCSSVNDPGSSTTHRGCYADITTQRNTAITNNPGLVTYAIGVGDVSQNTLNVIAGSSSRTLAVTDYSQLANRIDQILLLTCDEPPPVEACGSCCGFCACGTCQAPDAPDPPSVNFCDSLNIQGLCYSVVVDGHTCTPPSRCHTSVCDRQLQRCVDSELVCNQARPCFNTTCDPNTPPPASPCKATTEYCDPANGCGTYAQCPSACCGRGICNGIDCTTPGVCTCEPNTDPTMIMDPTTCCLTPAPTPAPTEAPTNAPTNSPTEVPTNAPTEAPTNAPTPPPPVGTPTAPPTPAPTRAPTNAPTNAPTRAPTNAPTRAPTNAPTTPPIPDCYNQGTFCSGHGRCINATCNCTDGFTGVNCANSPNVIICNNNAQCDDTNNCTDDICINPGTSDSVCQNTEKNCDDGNACTTDSCDIVSGCKNLDISSTCDDNNPCTDQKCDPSVGCVVTNRSCAAFEDICNTAYCDPNIENVSEQCVKAPITCPRDPEDNCTLAQCNIDDPTVKRGCYNTTTDCSNLGAIIGALTGGAIAGIAVGAGLIALAALGGTAYAASNLFAQDTENEVNTNPLYKQKAKEAAGLAT